MVLLLSAQKKNNGVEIGDDQRTRSQNCITKQHLKNPHVFQRN